MITVSYTKSPRWTNSKKLMSLLLNYFHKIFAIIKVGLVTRPTFHLPILLVPTIAHYYNQEISRICITMSCTAIVQKLQHSKSSSSKHRVSVPPCRRTSRYFLCILAIWASVNIFRILLLPPLSCSTAGRRQERDSEYAFLQWAQSGVPPGVRPCLNFSQTYHKVSVRSLPQRYMMVVVSGGLNQQRNQIIDAVLIARIIRATFVIPVLQVNQVWGDER